MPVDERPPVAWPDAALQIAQTLTTGAAALLLAKWGLVSGQAALAALGLSAAPAFVRLAGRLTGRSGPPSAP